MGKERFDTWTGETIFYDDTIHAYTTPDGLPMVSGSAYAASKLSAFNADKAAEYVAKANKLSKATILDTWEHNGDTSRMFGTAFHSAMDQWFKFRGTGTAKNYHLSKVKYLRDAVLTFPLRDAELSTEVLVSSVPLLMAGRIDALRKIAENVYEIIDFKTDSNVDRNLEHHELQLNFYRKILEFWGKKITGMTIWAYDGAWTCRPLKRVEIN